MPQDGPACLRGSSRRAQRVARRAAIVAAALAVSVLLSGCGAGKHPATLDDAPLDARSANAGPIAVRGAIVVASSTGGSAQLVATIVNTGTESDTLTGVTFTTSDGGNATATLKPATIGLLPQRLVRIPDGSRPLATISSSFVVGTYVTARLAFGNAGNVDMTLLVVAPKGPYETYGSTPAPTT